MCSLLFKRESEFYYLIRNACRCEYFLVNNYVNVELFLGVFTSYERYEIRRNNKFSNKKKLFPDEYISVIIVKINVI